MVDRDLFEVAQYVIIFNSEDKVLMVRTVDSNSRIGKKWGFPGGHLEDGENVESSIEREVWEEVGVNISGLRPILTNVVKKTYSVIFGANFVSGDLNLSNEHSEAGWFSLEEMKELDLIDPVLIKYAKKARVSLINRIL